MNNPKLFTSPGVEENHAPNQSDSRRDLLERSKLSRLPQRNSFQLPALETTSVCINCTGRLDADDNIQQSVKVCRKCLTQYAVIDSAIDAASKRKTKEMLEKMAGGAK